MKKYLEKQIGASVIMLVEQVKKNISYGKTQHFNKIKINNPLKEGEIVKCLITEINQNILSGNLI